MDTTQTLLELAGNVAMLLWGLHMVQSGVMRAFGTDIRRHMGVALRKRIRPFFAGMFATTILQSSTAVGLMASSFTATGLVDLVPALALMLGANVGTTLIVQILSFDINQVAPILVLVGVVTFKRAGRSRWRDVGRMIIGLGFMLFALGQMVALLHPAEQSQAIRLLLRIVGQDHFIDMLLAAILTWMMHSSVAMVLLIMSLAGQNLIPVKVAFALVIGANLGSAINPLMESGTRHNPASQRLPLGNLLNRMAGCILLLPLLIFTDMLPKEWFANTAHAVANFHTLFNLVLAVLFFPFLPLLAKFLNCILPEQASAADPAIPLYLDAKAHDTPSVALANASREALRMADVAGGMLSNTMQLLIDGDRKRVDEIRHMDDVLDQLNRQIKHYVTSLSSESLTPEDHKHATEVLAFAMNMEHVGDIVESGLMKVGAKKIKRRVVFSTEGWDEIRAMFERVINNVQLASAVFISREVRAARQLVAEKAVMRELEAHATETHFERLRDGRPESIETSALHLDILRDLKRINSHLSAAAMHVLADNGELLRSRLKEE